METLRENFRLKKCLNAYNSVTVFFFLIGFLFLIIDARAQTNYVIGGINMGRLPNYHMVFTNGSVDANWQGATKGFVGDFAVDGIEADERTSGNVPYAGIIYTNDATLSAWQHIVDANPGQAFGSYNEVARISGLETDLENAFSQVNALAVSPGYTNVSATSLNGLNTQNGIAETFVINITSGFSVSSKINITGDAGDVFILRWDTDADFSNGYNGQVKFQSGGAIVPLGALNASNFIHVAGDIGSSGGGSNPPLPYPQGPRTNNGTGSLITGGANFSGGGFFTGYWLTTGGPTISGSGQPYGNTSSLSNGVFAGGWYTKTNKFSMTSGTSGVYVSPSPAVQTIMLSGNVWHDVNAMDDNLVSNSGALQSPPAAGIPVGLRAYLVDASTGLVVKAVLVNSVARTYSFTGVTPNKTYFVYLSNQLGAIGAPPPAATLPEGWEHTGQKLGITPGSDGINDGRLLVPVLSVNVTNANFGIRRKDGEVIIGF